VKISQSTNEISQVPISIDAVPDVEGCPCLPAEVHSVIISIQVDSPENIGNPFGIVKISQSTSEISQVPVSFDHLSRHTRLPMFASGSSQRQCHHSIAQHWEHGNDR